MWSLLITHINSEICDRKSLASSRTTRGSKQLPKALFIMAHRRLSQDEVDKPHPQTSRAQSTVLPLTQVCQMQPKL
jgi:hypothetical protein